MVDEHWDAIESAEYCFAEGGNVMREVRAGQTPSVQTLEKIPFGIELAGDGTGRTWFGAAGEQRGGAPGRRWPPSAR